MEWNIIVAVVCGAVTLVGAVETSYQIYKMTVIDARSRGLKHPKFWGVFAMNGNNSSGLLMYLIGRRKFAIQNMSDNEKLEIEKRKKSAGIGLIFLVVGTIGFIFSIMNIV